jgi:hypothetical protein
LDGAEYRRSAKRAQFRPGNQPPGRGAPHSQSRVIACHTVTDLGDPAWQKARAKIHISDRIFSRLRAVTVYVVFPFWQQLMATLALDKPLVRPP